MFPVGQSQRAVLAFVLSLLGAVAAAVLCVVFVGGVVTAPVSVAAPELSVVEVPSPPAAQADSRHRPAEAAQAGPDAALPTGT